VTTWISFKKKRKKRKSRLRNQAAFLCKNCRKIESIPKNCKKTGKIVEKLQEN
jgi:hypothetical protein